MIDNIAVSKAMYGLDGHMTKLDWYVHTCQAHEYVVKHAWCKHL